MMKIVLISCASKKRPYRCRAEELYTSPLFTKSIQYARKLKPDRIFILSAKYGLLDLNAVIEPYDLTLSGMPVADVKAWADRVYLQLAEQVDIEHSHFIFLAGARYRKYLMPLLASCEVPMARLSIGKQLQFLSKEFDERNLR